MDGTPNAEFPLRLSLIVNDKTYEVDVAPDTPLLWVLRDELDLKGTKYSCGIAECGACTVALDGKPARACDTPVAEVAGRRVRTLEGGGRLLERLQGAWLADSVVQCGYCHPGMLMQAALLLEQNASPSDAEIDRWMAGNLCRCGTYARIRRAIHRAAKEAVDAR